MNFELELINIDNDSVMKNVWEGGEDKERNLFPVWMIAGEADTKIFVISSTEPSCNSWWDSTRCSRCV